jgi:hypothetical protein
MASYLSSSASFPLQISVLLPLAPPPFPVASFFPFLTFSFFLLIVFFVPFRYSPSFCYLTPPLFLLFLFLVPFLILPLSLTPPICLPLLVLFPFSFSSTFSFFTFLSLHLLLPSCSCLCLFSLPFILSESDTLYVSLFFCHGMMIPWYHAAFLYFRSVFCWSCLFSFCLHLPAALLGR